MPDPIPTRNYSDLPLAERLEAAHGALQALTDDPDVAAAMDAYGYDAARVAEGAALYTAARDAFDAQRAAYGDQFEDSAALRAALASAYDEWKRLAGVARVAFDGQPATLAALGVANLPQRTAERLARFRQFSTTAREPEHLPALAPYNVTATDLDAFDGLLQTLDTALHTADASRADSQDRTATRDAVTDALDDWMGRMHAIARLALKGRPQLLEKLGLVVP